MYKARSLEGKSEIIILDLEGNWEAVDALRETGRQGKLVCPQCFEPVRVRAGKKKRWHFAHQDLGSCPLQRESAQILSARGLIYKWLRSKDSLETVSLERTLDGYTETSLLPRPLDCYAQTAQGIQSAYWIFEHGVRDRTVWMRELSDTGIQIHWVFLASMLKHSKAVRGSQSVLLTPTERDCLKFSQYNQLYHAQNGFSLHYLDIDDHVLMTLRGVNLVHPPQEYGYSKLLLNNLDSVLIEPATGEFVHPGEHELLVQLQKEICAREERLHEAEDRREQKRQALEKKAPGEKQQEKTAARCRKLDEKSAKDRPNFLATQNGPFTCDGCGKTITEWVQWNPVLCRDCMKNRY